MRILSNDQLMPCQWLNTMKILVAHNFYQQPGGEDNCVAAEAALLKAHGHEVFQYYLHNDSINALSRFQAAARTIWNRSASPTPTVTVSGSGPSAMRSSRRVES